MTKPIREFSASSPSTTASSFPESVRRSLARLPESSGTPVVVLTPIEVQAPLPDGFVDIDVLVEQAEKDPDTRRAIKAGRQSVAANYYAKGPQSLAFYRLRHGWSQKELAGRLGTSQSYIARLEAGNIDPQVSTLRRLATVLDVQPAVLLNSMTHRTGRP